MWKSWGSKSKPKIALFLRLSRIEHSSRKESLVRKKAKMRTETQYGEISREVK